jgi:hypothetical protein
MSSITDATPGTDTENESGERTALMEHLRDPKSKLMIAIETAATKRYGGPAAGVVVRQLLFWDGRSTWTKDDDLGFFKSYPEWQEETGLHRSHVDIAGEKLCNASVLKRETRKAPDNRLRRYYRLYPFRLMEDINDYLSDDYRLVEKNESPANATLLIPAGTMQDPAGTMQESAGYTEDNPEDNPLVRKEKSFTSPSLSGSSPKQVLRSPPKMEKPEGNKDFPGDLEAIKGDLDNLVDQAKDDFADPEELKKTADEAGYYFMSNSENVTTKEQHAVFGAIREAKALIDTTSSFPLTSLPCGKYGSDEAVKDLPSVYDADSMGEALLRAIDEAVDSLDEAVDGDKRRGFKKLLVQWQHARDRETAESPPCGPVTDGDSTSRPALSPADQKTVQGILDAVEIESF